MMEAFHVRVNDGPVKIIKVKTGIYVSAAAAVPALLGYKKYPMKIEIWMPDLLPDYGPYEFWIERAGTQVGRRTKLGGETVNLC